MFLSNDMVCRGFNPGSQSWLTLTVLVMLTMSQGSCPIMLPGNLRAAGGGANLTRYLNIAK